MKIKVKEIKNIALREVKSVHFVGGDICVKRIA